MKSILHFVILLVYLSLTNSYFDYDDLRRNLNSHLQLGYQSRKRLPNNVDIIGSDPNSKYGQWVQEKEVMRSHLEHRQGDALENENDANEREDRNDVMKAREKALVLSKAKGKEAELNELNVLADAELINDKIRYHMDPVFSLLRNGNMRRDYSLASAETLSESSTRELGDFKEQFRELWLQKKYEAMNSSLPGGDQVNMAAARPWGLKCGDASQHDMPWGTCMLGIECEAEYRIFRGDVFCGRTSFVCCALEVSTYDMYQGFDVSFEDKSLSTDTEEIRHRENKDTSKKKFLKDKKKRKDTRTKRKKRIKKHIKNIMLEIHKILNKIYQNSSKQRKTRSRQMKKLIKKLKKEYKKDRIAVKDLHEEYMIKIDAALMKRINEIMALNQNFMKNSTFASIVINGSMSKEGARMLVQAYPELASYISDARRNSDGKHTPDYLDYDVEYGFLYY